MTLPTPTPLTDEDHDFIVRQRVNCYEHFNTRAETVKNFLSITDRLLATITSLQSDLQRTRYALQVLVSAKAIKNIRSMVAGWNGEGRADGLYDRHPAKLGAIIETNCGAVYALDEAMTAARSILTPPTGT